MPAGRSVSAVMPRPTGQETGGGGPGGGGLVDGSYEERRHLGPGNGLAGAVIERIGGATLG